MSGPYKFVIILYLVFLGSVLISNIVAMGYLATLRIARRRSHKKMMAAEEAS